MELDRAGIDAERVRSDLCERRLVPLPVRRRAGANDHAPIGLDANGCRLPAGAYALHVEGNADAREPAVCAGPVLLGAQLVVARKLERCVDEGPDRTRLRGWVKAYVPLREAPASER